MEKSVENYIYVNWTINLTNLETCIEIENRVCDASAEQRKNWATDSQFRERLVYTKMIATHVSW